MPRPPAIRTCGIDVTTKVDVSDYTSSAGEDSCDTVIYVGPNGRISDQDLTDNEGPPIENHTPTNNLSLADCIEINGQPRFASKKVNVVKPMTSPPAINNSTSENNDSDATETPLTPVKSSLSPSNGTTVIGDFIVSDCDDENGRQSPCFGPRAKPAVIQNEEPSEEKAEKKAQVQVNEDLVKSTEELEMSVDEDAEECERIDLCSVIKSSRKTLKFDENANERIKRERDEVIEVFVEDGQKEIEKDLNLTRLDENVSDIISKTRPKVDYFRHEVDEEDLSYLHMGPVTEKELRKSERRIKKLLKGGLIGGSHVHAHSTADDSYMSECEATQSKRRSSRNDSSGYCSAPETEIRQRRLQKIFSKSIEAADVTAHAAKTDSVIVRPEVRVTSPTKRLSAEETRTLLKDFVAKKIEQRTVSPERHSNGPIEKRDNDLVDQKETFFPSSYAEVKYVPTCKANITSTRLCRGSFSSVQSSEANSFSPPSSETSYDKADTISMASFAGSEDRNETSGLCSPMSDKSNRRIRSPVKIHYRWSTVFEEDEKSKHGSQKSIVNNDKQINESKKTKALKKSEVKAGTSKSPKVESKNSKKSPKIEQKRSKLSKPKDEIMNSPNVLKNICSNDVGSSRHSVSGCSEISGSSGIATNDNSSLSQQSFQSSPLTSVRDQPSTSHNSPISPRSRRWFFR